MWNAVESYTYFVCVCVSLKESRVYWKLSMKCLQAMNETKWNVAKKNVRWTSERAKSGIERRCTLGAILYCEWFFRARERKTSGVSCCVHEIWQLFEVLKHQFSTMSTPHFKHLYVCAAINSLRIRLEAFRKCSFVLLAKKNLNQLVFSVVPHTHTHSHIYVYVYIKKQNADIHNIKNKATNNTKRRRKNEERQKVKEWKNQKKFTMKFTNEFTIWMWTIYGILVLNWFDFRTAT